jgi:hypothetical protein
MPGIKPFTQYHSNGGLLQHPFKPYYCILSCEKRHYVIPSDYSSDRQWQHEAASLCFLIPRITLVNVVICTDFTQWRHNSATILFYPNCNLVKMESGKNHVSSAVRAPDSFATVSVERAGTKHNRQQGQLYYCKRTICLSVRQSVCLSVSLFIRSGKSSASQN